MTVQSPQRLKKLFVNPNNLRQGTPLPFPPEIGITDVAGLLVITTTIRLNASDTGGFQFSFVPPLLSE
jgi:hypothetical protein